MDQVGLHRRCSNRARHEIAVPVLQDFDFLAEDVDAVDAIAKAHD